MKNELSDMKNELSELRKNYNNLKADLKVSKSVTEAMKNHIIVLERKCWSNEQYCRRECLEISGIPSNTEAGKLGKTLLKVFEKVDVDVDHKNVKDCHWLKTRNSSKNQEVGQSTRCQEVHFRLKLHMMLIWRISLQETHCCKIILRIEKTLTNYTSQMLCFYTVTII